MTPQRTDPAATPALSFINVAKTFGGFRALKPLSADLRAGTVYGLIGRNGSGKSTLIKVLAGVEQGDHGSRILVNRAELHLPPTPASLRATGVAFVHQDLGLVHDLSILENLRLHRLGHPSRIRVAWRRHYRLAEMQLDAMGITANPRAPISTLTPVERALVAIARALDDLGGDGVGVLVLDEPTAYLDAYEVQRLFAQIRRLRDRGVCVLLVTHRLSEVIELCDDVLVLRDGHLVSAEPVGTVSQKDLVQRMLGQPLNDLYPQRSELRPHLSEAALVATDVEGSRIGPFSLAVAAGEILGITGLVGAGHDDVPRMLFGAQPACRGSIVVGESCVDLADVRPRMLIENGVALLPADRRGHSGVLDLTTRANVSLPTLRQHARHGRIVPRAERRASDALLREHEVRPPDGDASLGSLSGGNQQKALLAKWLCRRPSVLLLHEPTQGIDIGGKRDVFRRLRTVADSGTAVLYCSVEYEDLAQICDRVLIFRDGSIVAELSRGQLSEAAIVAACQRSEALVVGETVSTA